MNKISGRFAGCETDGLIVAASSPMTESVDKVLKCRENGAAAVVLKTASKTRMPSSSNAPRRFLVRGGFFWAKSSFNTEILTLEDAQSILKGCKSSGVTIPVAASVTELSLESADWLEDCGRMEAAGADAVQLDFFYIENMFSAPDFEKKFVKLLCDITNNVRIPVIPKLNVSFPAEYAARLLKQGGIKYVSLLDSIKTPPPVFIDWQDCETDNRRPVLEFEEKLCGGGLSVFGSFMFPLTAQYTDVLAKAGFEVCAGGGVTDGRGAANLLILGASSVQVATDVLLNGFRRFSALNGELDMINRHAVSEYFHGRHGGLDLFHELGGNIRSYK
jgi:dihydroorotate dehydrogenase